MALELTPNERLISRDIEDGLKTGNFSKAIFDMSNKQFQVDWKHINDKVHSDGFALPFQITGIDDGAIKGEIDGTSTTYRIDKFGHVDKQTHNGGDGAIHEYMLATKTGKMEPLRTEAKLLNPRRPEDGQVVLWHDHTNRVQEIEHANGVRDEIRYGRDGNVDAIRRTYHGTLQNSIEADPEHQGQFLVRNEKGISTGTSVSEPKVSDTGLITAKVAGGDELEWDIDGSFRRRGQDDRVHFMQDANGVQYSYSWDSVQPHDPHNPFQPRDSGLPNKITIQGPGMQQDIVMTRDQIYPTGMENYNADYKVTYGGMSPQVDSIPIMVPVAHGTLFADLSIPIYASVDQLRVGRNGEISYSFEKGPFYGKKNYSFTLNADGSQDRNCEGVPAHTSPAHATMAPGIPTI